MKITTRNYNVNINAPYKTPDKRGRIRFGMRVTHKQGVYDPTSIRVEVTNRGVTFYERSTSEIFPGVEYENVVTPVDNFALGEILTHPDFITLLNEQLDEIDYATVVPF